MKAFICLFFIFNLFIIFVTWKSARVALLRRKKKLKAHEARLISDTFESKIKRIENGIYEDIRTSAFCGNKYVQVCIDKDIDVSHETISANLKRDGYKVSWYFSADTDAYVYDIWW